VRDVTHLGRRDGGGIVNAFIDFTVIPEPGTAVLVLVGLAAMGIRGRRSS
jgi:hypothetical protein